MINFNNMSSTDNILLLLGFFLLFILIAFYLAFYLKSWTQKLQYIKMEIHRARNERELRHWKREQKILYWSLIPGLSTIRIKKIIRFFKKDKKKTDK